jgi:hypothetical protein
VKGGKLVQNTPSNEYFFRWQVTYQAFQNGPIVEQLFCKLVLKPTPPSEDVDEQFNRVYGALAIMEAAQQGAEVDKPTAYGTLRAVSDFIGQSLSSQRPQSKRYGLPN